MIIPRCTAAGLLVLAFACGDATEGLRDAAARTSAPEILELSVTPMTMRETNVVRVEATVVDADGDLASGRLETEAGASLGLFVNASASAYVFPLAWQILHEVEPIEFEGPEIRTLYARFMDAEGQVTRAPVRVELECATDAACDGRCVDLLQDWRNCGRCGRVCPQASAMCWDGRCPPEPSECVPIEGVTSCDEVCLHQGGYCNPGRCEGDGSLEDHSVYPDLAACQRFAGSISGRDCLDPLDPSLGGYARCCCVF